MSKVIDVARLRSSPVILTNPFTIVKNLYINIQILHLFWIKNRVNSFVLAAEGDFDFFGNCPGHRFRINLYLSVNPQFHHSGFVAFWGEF